MAEPRPAALPPAERTVGQLVGESIRFYGDHFWQCLALGLAPAALAVVGANVSRTIAVVLSPTLFGAVLSAAYVGASVLVLEQRPDNRTLVVAWLAGWIVVAPVPFLVLGFIVPGVAWLAALGLVVPVLVVEDLPLRAAFRRAWQLARADYLHAFGSVATLGIVVFLTQAVLAFTLRNFGGTEVSVAFFLAIVVVSPLLFVGTALLYVDQDARVE
jgi:MFS family permease